MLRGHAGLLEDALESFYKGQDRRMITVLKGVIHNLRRDADDEEQRGKDWNEQRKAELAKLGIPEGEPMLPAPPRQEPW